MCHKFLVLVVKRRLKSVYIYGSYRKIETGVSLFGPLCIFSDSVQRVNEVDVVVTDTSRSDRDRALGCRPVLLCIQQWIYDVMVGSLYRCRIDIIQHNWKTYILQYRKPARSMRSSASQFHATTFPLVLVLFVIWNSLPSDILQSHTLSSFRRHLKS